MYQLERQWLVLVEDLQIPIISISPLMPVLGLSTQHFIRFCMTTMKFHWTTWWKWRMLSHWIQNDVKNRKAVHNVLFIISYLGYQNRRLFVWHLFELNERWTIGVAPNSSKLLNVIFRTRFETTSRYGTKHDHDSRMNSFSSNLSESLIPVPRWTSIHLLPNPNSIHHFKFWPASDLIEKDLLFIHYSSE